MNWVKELIAFITDLLKWWVIVLPWESGIRVRAGKHRQVLKPGVWLKLPVIDTVFRVSNRLRYIGTPMQTVTTRDRHAISVTATVGYVIQDVEKLFNQLYSPSATITSMAMAEIAAYCAKRNIVDCTPMEIEMECAEKLDLAKYGLGDVKVKVTGYAVVKTYRLIQDQSWLHHEEENK